MRAAITGLGAVTLVACGTLSGGSAAAPPGAAAVTADVPSTETRATYDGIVARLRAGDPAAQGKLETFSAAHPDLAGPLLNLGLVRARSGDDAGAQDLLRRATQVCNQCGTAWNQLGVLHRQHGRFADAEQAYLRAIALESGYAPAYYNLAVLYELYLPRPEQALENYERFLQLDGTADGSQDVEKWVADLRRRISTTATTARADGST
ncbi:MAG: tetratricopeptide repeat protein [Gammaproteobacteria bacterium]